MKENGLRQDYVPRHQQNDEISASSVQQRLPRGLPGTECLAAILDGNGKKTSRPATFNEQRAASETSTRGDSPDPADS
jgi:hypothetical protein